MDEEENYKDETAKARLKRKLAMQNRNTKKSRASTENQNLTPNVSGSKLTASQQRRIRDSNATPLSNISSLFLNQYGQGNTPENFMGAASSNLHTSPSTNFRSNTRKNRLDQMNSVGVNLMTIFADQENTISNLNCGNNAKNHPTISEQTFTSRLPTATQIESSQFETQQGKSQTSEEEHNISRQNTDAVEDLYITSDYDSEWENHLDEDEALQDNGYIDIGDAVYQCKHCNANMWYGERTRKNFNSVNPKFNLCCGGGKIQLPHLKDPPDLLQHLLFGHDSTDSKNYQKHLRSYNMMFAFTSPGHKIDRSLMNGRGPPNFRIQGQSCHLIGSLLPMPGHKPKFAQLYIYDTENEIQNRLSAFRSDDKLNPQIVEKLKNMLDAFNSHAKSFRMAKERYKSANGPELGLRLISNRTTDGRTHNLPSVNEVAALIPGDIEDTNCRDIVLEKQNGKLIRINELHASYLGYQYPLLFPYGEDGYRDDVSHRDNENGQQKKRNKVTIREWFCYRLQSRNNEAQTLLRSQRLFQQFLVDAYTMIESDRLSFIRNNQKKLRVDKYSSLNNSSNQNETQGSSRGKRIVLPSTFVGGRRYMDQLYYDGMAICGALGFPDLFLTFTCNPNWPEIQRLLSPLNLKAHDRPDIISRVFKLKFDQLLTDLKINKIFGDILGYMYTIEFQKRGLPHAHILIFLHPSNKFPNPEDIDKIISAEIPDQLRDKSLYDVVKSHMMHGPCGSANKKAPCMKDGYCSKYFPKNWQGSTIIDHQGYPEYRRRNNGNVIERNGIIFDNRHVVPYNPTLLLRYRAHLNIEWCNQANSIKYLFKYIHKGYDRITASIVNTRDGDTSEVQVVDEVKQYLDCRYISPCEACWRIYSFPLQGRMPAVERLYFHLAGEQFVMFADQDDIDSLLDKPTVNESMFTSWLEANKIYPDGHNLTYTKYVSKFVYHPSQRCWKPRKQGYTIGRLNWVSPATGELFYLRMILTVAKGPCTYEDIRTFGGIQYPTYREACFAMGFLQDDREYIEAIKEANNWGSGIYLRKLFVTMLISNSISRPEHVWKETWKCLVDGILYQQRKIAKIQDMQLSDLELQNLALVQIEELLQANRKSLRDYPSMPFPEGMITSNLGNRLIYAERNYDKSDMREQFLKCFTSLTDEQSKIFETIMKAVNDQNGAIFFLEGFGGSGKTFMWNTFATDLRSRGDIVLTTASSGIASLLLPGGKTAHSKFAIPVPTLKNSTCNIHQGSELAELLKITKLIIWDEAPMANKFCFEALDKSLRDIMSFSENGHKLFGGKVIVFGGDFRQILPVVPRGCRSDIINATINSSYIWDSCTVLKLTKNMRLQTGGTNTNLQELREFSEWLLQVGDGKLSEPNDGYADIKIPDEFLIKDFKDPIHAIVQNTYPDIVQNYNNEIFLKERAILASTIQVVDELNDYILSIIPGEEKEYLSSDSVDMSDIIADDAIHALTPEFLNTLRTSGIPNHRIKLKIGTPIMLMRNLDQSEGLCNRTRLIVTRLANHVIEAKIISGKNVGNLTYISRMSLSPSDSPWPFKLIRRQFPIITSYAMTINKSQGQSLANVGLYLPNPVFSHGQLYVAFSRVQSKKGLKILIHDKDKKPLSTTTNVVFKEVFQNLR